MDKENLKPIVLPSGETIAVKIPEAPTRNTRGHAIARCKFHIPLKTLEKEMGKGRWPNLEVLNQAPGTLKTPEAELWTGTEIQWKEHLRAQEQVRCAIRVHKLRAIRKTQQALKRITAEEWAAMKAIFTIQRQFN